MIETYLRILRNRVVLKTAKSFLEQDKVREAKSEMFDLKDQTENAFSLFEVINVVD